MDEYIGYFIAGGTEKFKLKDKVTGATRDVNMNFLV
jgi:hypothetical protein